MDKYLNPEGRLNPSEFIRGGSILIVASVILSLLQQTGIVAIVVLANLLSLFLIYPWVVMWIKRYHEAGKPGWFALIPLLLFIIGFYFVSVFTFSDEFKILMEAYESGVSQEELSALMQELVKPKEILFLLVTTLYSLAFLHGFNKLIKSDPNENEYGPA